jgi:hypothetical protein
MLTGLPVMGLLALLTGLFTVLQLAPTSALPFPRQWRRWLQPRRVSLVGWSRPAGLTLPSGATLRAVRDGALTLPQRWWDWFDHLSNVQTVGFLVALLLALLATSSYLLAASLQPSLASLAASAETHSAPSGVPSPAEVAAPRQRPQPRYKSEPVELRAMTLPPSLYLRSQPTTGSSVLAVLGAGSEVVLLGPADSVESSSWVQVRAPDGQVGWVIATALE